MQTRNLRLLYRFYSLLSNFYFRNPAMKAAFNWGFCNLCATPPGTWAAMKLHKKFLDFPARLQIETTTYCNAKCVMCAHARMPRRSRHMDQALYEKLIRELGERRDQLKVLSLHFMGEPLMDPLIFDRIQLAKEAGIREVQFNTNCQLLTPERAQRLIDSGIDTITFSLGGLEKESQDERRLGTSSQTVEQNIEYCIGLIESQPPGKKVKKFIYTIKSSSRDRAYEPIVAKYKGRVDGISVVNQNNWGGTYINEEKNAYLAGNRLPCPLLFSTMLINVNGLANICCLDWEDREVMGDATTASLHEIWRGKKMERYRLLHLKKKSDSISLCRECTLFK